MELEKKIKERLAIMFDTLQRDTPLLNYELVQVVEMLNFGKEERTKSVVKVESYRVVTEQNSFWCCRNLVF